jgi:hypothetical protein
MYDVHLWPVFGENNLGSQSGGFRKIFRDAGGYQKAGASSKRVTGRIFTISK